MQKKLIGNLLIGASALSTLMIISVLVFMLAEISINGKN